MYYLLAENIPKVINYFAHFFERTYLHGSQSTKNHLFVRDQFHAFFQSLIDKNNDFDDCSRSDQDDNYNIKSRLGCVITFVMTVTSLIDIF